MNCPTCGKQNEAGIPKCVQCGTVLPPPPAPPTVRPAVKRISKTFFVISSVVTGLGWVGFELGITMVLFGKMMYRIPGASLAVGYASDIASLGFVGLMYGGVVVFIMLHKQWRAIQDGYTKVTPGKAVGYLFIPFYGFYWLFRAFYGYAQDYNAYVDRYALPVPKLPGNLFLAQSVLWLLFTFMMYAPGVGAVYAAVIAYVGLRVTIAVCDGVNAIATDRPEPVRQRPLPEMTTTAYPVRSAGAAQPGAAASAAAGPVVSAPSTGSATHTTTADSAPAQASGPQTGGGVKVPNPEIAAQPPEARTMPPVAPTREPDVRATGPGQSTTERAVSDSLGRVRRSLKATGVWNIVVGALFAVTVVGFPVAWIPVLLGILALRAAAGAKRYETTSNPEALAATFRRLKAFHIVNTAAMSAGAVALAGGVGYLAVQVATGQLPYLLKYLAYTFTDWAKLL